MVEHETREPKVSYSLPRFDDWQADQEWRLQLEASVYVDSLDVGRGIVVTGRVGFRTIPGRPDGSGQYAGWYADSGYLYRSDSPMSRHEVSDAAMGRIRAAVVPFLAAPSDELRLAEGRAEALRRNARALSEYRQTNSDTAKLANRLADALGVPLTAIAAERATT